MRRDGAAVDVALLASLRHLAPCREEGQGLPQVSFPPNPGTYSPAHPSPKLPTPNPSTPNGNPQTPHHKPRALDRNPHAPNPHAPNPQPLTPTTWPHNLIPRVSVSVSTSQDSGMFDFLRAAASPAPPPPETGPPQTPVVATRRGERGRWTVWKGAWLTGAVRDVVVRWPTPVYSTRDAEIAEEAGRWAKWADGAADRQARGGEGGGGAVWVTFQGQSGHGDALERVLLGRVRGHVEAYLRMWGDHPFVTRYSGLGRQGGQGTVSERGAWVERSRRGGWWGPTRGARREEREGGAMGEVCALVYLSPANASSRRAAGLSLSDPRPRHQPLVEGGGREKEWEAEGGRVVVYPCWLVQQQAPLGGGVGDRLALGIAYDVRVAFDDGGDGGGGQGLSWAWG